MKAYVLVSVRTGMVKEAVKNLRRLQGVQSAHITFGPYDAVAVIEAPDVKRLGELLASEIQPIPGVEGTLTCLAVDE
ncbi:MAG: Lrp/AsnC ligand binding domain-containing protein [Planctomycetaceae bacterium]|nr:Lrp/AsnC ligand binding domain-containing protein [Planctomycetota bacterium]NUN52072.1 Lrp/AsnC ligand binding domain-containing protein [Planctomycetaceae bacterium]